MGRRHAAAWTALGPRVVSVELVDRAAFNSLPRIVAGCEVVDVCLPTPMHADVADAALAADRHVLVEKPIALRLDDADRILAAARRASGRLMIAHVVRFFPAYRRLLALGSSLGAPLGAQAYRFTAADPAIGWLADAAQSGGALVDLLVHDYDVLNAVLGAPISAVARTDATGTASVVVDYGRGRVGSVVGSMALPSDYPFAAGARVIFEGGVAEALPSGTFRVVDRSGVHDERPPAVDPYLEQARYFLDCLDAGRAPSEGTVEQARAALAVAVAASQSAASGDVVPVQQ